MKDRALRFVGQEKAQVRAGRPEIKQFLAQLQSNMSTQNTHDPPPARFFETFCSTLCVVLVLQATAFGPLRAARAPETSLAPARASPRLDGMAYACYPLRGNGFRKL